MDEKRILKGDELDNVTGGTTIKGRICNKYTVTDPSGEELSDIAQKCGCLLSELFDLNDLKTGNRAPIGTELYYPAK